MALKKSELDQLKAKALANDVEAQKELYRLYSSRSTDGIVELDEREAFKWLWMAAETGDADARNMFDSHYDLETKILRLTELANTGHQDAIESLAYCYFDNDEIDKAINWLKILFERHNDSDTANDLANLYCQRIHTWEDCALAVAWFEKAVDMGNPEAAFELASCYEYGFKLRGDRGYSELIIGPNLHKAAEWYLKGAEMGDERAQHDYAIMCYEGNCAVTRNYKSAFHWMLKAACCNMRLFNSGLHIVAYYTRGIGTDINIFEAYVWALLTKDDIDPKQMDQLEKALTREEIEEAQDEADRRKELDKIKDRGKTLYEHVTSYSRPQANAVETDADPEPEAFEQPQPDQETADATPTTNIEQYKHLGKIRLDKQGFDLSKVSLCLEAYPLTKDQKVDFSEITVSYADKGKDRKPMSLYHKYKVTEDQRRLLIQLAILSGNQSARERNLMRFIKNLASKRTSPLNSMFRKIFKGFAEPQNAMIDRGKGLLRVSLSIDMLNLRQARDYAEFEELLS